MILSLSQAFWKRVKRTKGCWTWAGTKNQAGRGQFIYQGKWFSAPRTSYRLLIGPIPKGVYVLHHCNNPSCVNPSHLFLGTQTDNMQDMVKKGRRPDTHEENGSNAKLTRLQVAEIKTRHRRWHPINGTKSLAKEFGVHVDVVQRIVNNRRWQSVDPKTWSEGVTV